ncbi:MAG: hypothetical protein QOI06_3038 [Nocardioidaceae bacterium]|jgi:hypothetical protein|nr:hypothetical protein [Nocardioidaceae bacterium]
MVPRVVVHIGAAKTATTAIQYALYENSDVLREFGVYLPRAGRFEFGSNKVVHHHLAWEYVDPQRFRPEIGGWDALAQELRQVDAGTVLISSESLERLTYSGDRRRELEERLTQLSDDITIVYVVRDQLSQLNSLYTQNVKSFRTTERFKPAVRKALSSGNLNFDRIFRPWYRSKMLTFVAVPFESLTAADPLLGLLGAAKIDVPADRLTTTRTGANESLGPVGVEAAKLLGGYLRGIDPEFTHKSGAAQKIYRLAAGRARENGWCADKFWGWDPQLAQHVADRFLEANRRFARAVWGRGQSVSMPVDRPQMTASLIDLPPEEIDVVQSYVSSMGRRYLELRTGRSYPSARAELQ